MPPQGKVYGDPTWLSYELKKKHPELKEIPDDELERLYSIKHPEVKELIGKPLSVSQRGEISQRDINLPYEKPKPSGVGMPAGFESSKPSFTEPVRPTIQPTVQLPEVGRTKTSIGGGTVSPIDIDKTEPLSFGRMDSIGNMPSPVDQFRRQEKTLGENLGKKLEEIREPFTRPLLGAFPGTVAKVRETVADPTFQWPKLGQTGMPFGNVIDKAMEVPEFKGAILELPLFATSAEGIAATLTGTAPEMISGKLAPYMAASRHLQNKIVPAFELAQKARVGMGLAYGSEGIAKTAKGVEKGSAPEATLGAVQTALSILGLRHAMSPGTPIPAEGRIGKGPIGLQPDDVMGTSYQGPRTVFEDKINPPMKSAGSGSTRPGGTPPTPSAPFEAGAPTGRDIFGGSKGTTIEGAPTPKAPIDARTVFNPASVRMRPTPTPKTGEGVTVFAPEDQAFLDGINTELKGKGLSPLSPQEAFKAVFENRENLAKEGRVSETVKKEVGGAEIDSAVQTAISETNADLTSKGLPPLTKQQERIVAVEVQKKVIADRIGTKLRTEATTKKPKVPTPKPEPFTFSAGVYQSQHGRPTIVEGPDAQFGKDLETGELVPIAQIGNTRLRDLQPEDVKVARSTPSVPQPTRSVPQEGGGTLGQRKAEADLAVPAPPVSIDPNLNQGMGDPELAGTAPISRVPTPPSPASTGPKVSPPVRARSTEAPPSRRIKIQRGQHDPVDVIFDNDNDKRIMQAFKKDGDPRNKQTYINEVSYKYKIPTSGPNTINAADGLRAYRRYVIDETKALPKTMEVDKGGYSVPLSTKVKSFDDFMTGTYLKGNKDNPITKAHEENQKDLDKYLDDSGIEKPAKMSESFESRELDPSMDKEQQDRQLMVMAAAHKEYAARELLQNATDAAFLDETQQHPRAGKVEITTTDRWGGYSGDAHITIKDDGPGLDLAGLATVYIKLFSSGKEGTKAAGKIGVGKSGYLYGGKKLEVISRTKKSGKLREYYFETTPQQMLDKKAVARERVPTGSDTGVTVTFYPEKEDAIHIRSGNISSLVDSLKHTQGIIKINTKFDNHIESYSITDLSEKEANLEKYTKQYPNYSITLTFEKDTEALTTRDPWNNKTAVTVSSNGMPHPGANFAIDSINAPRKVNLDISPKFDPTDPKGRFPFNIDRTQLKPDVQEEVIRYINANVINSATEAYLKKLKEAWDGMDKIHGITYNHRLAKDFYLFDEDKYLGVNQQTLAKVSPDVASAAKSIVIIYDKIMQRLAQHDFATDPKYSEHINSRLNTVDQQTDRLGFTFINEKKGNWGVNVPHPNNRGIRERSKYQTRTGDETYPEATYGSFLNIPGHVESTRTPHQFGFEIIQTLVHELAHNISRAEGHSQAIVINGILREVNDMLPELTNIVKEGFYESDGRLKEDIHELVQFANQSNGSPVSARFSLTGTGQNIKESGISGEQEGYAYSNKGSGSGDKKPRKIAKTKKERQTAAVDKVKHILNNIAPIRMDMNERRSEARSRRLREFYAVSRRGVAGMYEAMSKLKGPLPMADFESIAQQFSEGEKNILVNMVHDSNLFGFGRAAAYSGLMKMFNEDFGQLPTYTETEYLGDVFGKDFESAINKKRNDSGFLNVREFAEGMGKVGEKLRKSKFGTWYQRSENVPLDILDGFKALVLSLDAAAPGRQGLALIHKKEFWKSHGPMFKAMLSEKYHQQNQKTITGMIMKKLADEAGLELTSADGELGKTENDIAYGFAEAIPLVGVPVRMSNRGAVTFLNNLRISTFESLVMARYNHSDLASQETMNELKDIARFINIMTGRGSLGVLAPSAPVLNRLYFSVPWVASRIQLLDPRNYISKEFTHGILDKTNIDPDSGLPKKLGQVAANFGRATIPKFAKEQLHGKPPKFLVNEYRKALGALLAQGAILAGLGYLLKYSGILPDFEVGFDPRKSDFGKGKIKVGKRTIEMDYFGSVMQYIILATRLGSQEMVNTEGEVVPFDQHTGGQGPTNASTIYNWQANKNLPYLELILMRLQYLNRQTGKAPTDEDYKKKALQMVTPISVQDATEILRTSPWAAPLIIYAAWGGGITVKEEQPKSPFKLPGAKPVDKFDTPGGKRY